MVRKPQKESRLSFWGGPRTIGFPVFKLTLEWDAGKFFGTTLIVNRA